MSDLLTLGGVDTIYQPSALRDWTGSVESDGTCELLTDDVYPLGEGGSGVFQGVYVPVEYESGISLTITPVVDGKELVQARATFNRSGAGSEEFFLALRKRGSRIALKIESGVPTGRFAVLNRGVVNMEPLQDARPNPAGPA